MAICTDTFGRSWLHMIQLLFKPFRLEYWLKGALLVFFMQGYQGPKPNPAQWMQDKIKSGGLNDFYELVLHNLPLILVSLLVLFVVGVLFMFISACVQFIFFEGVKEGVFHFRKSFQKHLSSIISLFLWNLIFSVIIVSAVVLIGGIIAAGVMFMGQGNMGSLVIVIGILLGLVLVVLFFIFFTFYHTMLSGLVIPQMLVEQKGILESWTNAISIVLENLMEFLGFLVIQIGVGMVVGIVVFVFYMVFSLFAFAVTAAVGGVDNFPETFSAMQNYGLLIPFGMFIAVILLPSPVLLNSYILNFFAAIANKPEYCPVGCAPTMPTQPSAMQTTNSTPPASTETEVPPEPSFMQTQSKATTEGPVNFSDIPVEQPNNTNAPTPPSENTEGDGVNDAPEISCENEPPQEEPRKE